jgi:hypothetical protein
MEALDPMAIQELTYMFQQNSRLPMPFKVVLKEVYLATWWVYNRVQ